MRNLVTVVIPTYNRAELLREAIASVIYQTRSASQIIVVDDGSIDNTFDVVRSFGPAVTYLKQANSGKSAALNRALELVAGEFVWFFDDDDVALPDFIENHLQAFEHDPTLDMVVSPPWYGESDSKGKLIPVDCVVIPIEVKVNAFPTLLRRCAFNMQGILIRKAILYRVGPFDTRLLRSQDYDMIIRIFRDGRYLVLDNPDWIFRKHLGTRGPASIRHTWSDRERIWVNFDRMIGRKLREEVPLRYFLKESDVTQAIKPETEPREFIARGVVMATKGLVREFLADLDKATELSETNHLTKLNFKHISKEVIKAAWDEYVGISLLEMGYKNRIELLKEIRSPLSCYAMMAAAKSIIFRTLHNGTSLINLFDCACTGVHFWIKAAWQLQRIKFTKTSSIQ